MCKTHDPVEADKREAASQARYDVERQRRSLEMSGARFARVLQQIADGHNDPRTLAIETLGELYDHKPPPTEGAA